MAKHRGNLIVGFYDDERMKESITDPRGKGELAVFMDKRGEAEVHDFTGQFESPNATEDEKDLALEMACAIGTTSDSIPVFDWEYCVRKVAEAQEKTKKQVRKQIRGMLKRGITIEIWLPIEFDDDVKDGY